MTVLMMAYAMIGYLLGETVSGWTSITMIVLGVAGVQFLLIGVMGEYIGRLYMESKRQSAIRDPGHSLIGGIAAIRL